MNRSGQLLALAAMAGAVASVGQGYEDLSPSYSKSVKKVRAGLPSPKGQGRRSRKGRRVKGCGHC